MSDPKKDHDGIVSLEAIYEGIKKGIEVTFENECYGSTIILILAGIDVMAYLSMPAEQIEVTSKDYISWVDRYIRLPGKEQITGPESRQAQAIRDLERELEGADRLELQRRQAEVEEAEARLAQTERDLEEELEGPDKFELAIRKTKLLQQHQRIQKRAALSAARAYLRLLEAIVLTRFPNWRSRL